MMPSASVTPRFWQAANARSAWSYTTGMFSSGSPPKKVMRQPLRLQLVEPLLDPGGQTRAVVERHPIGVFVVVAVVALKAVVAGEIALQRRQHRHAHLLGVFAVVGEELVQRLGVGRAAGDDEAVFGQRHQRFALVAVEPFRRKRRGVVSTGDRADRQSRPTTISCASVRVFIRNTSPRSGSGTRRLNIDCCIAFVIWKTEANASAGKLRGRRSDRVSSPYDSLAQEQRLFQRSCIEIVQNVTFCETRTCEG